MKRSPTSSKAFNGDLGNDESEPEAYAWVKTTGQDHYHHSLLYCHVASQMVHHLPERGNLPLFIGTFRNKT